MILSFSIKNLLKPNQIIEIKSEDYMYPGNFDYWPYIEKYPNFKEKIEHGSIVLSESYTVQNGLGGYKTNFYLKEFDKFMTQGTIHKVYFLEYLNQYQNAQNCISETKRKYNLLNNYPKVQDGWNIVSANNGVDFCDVRKVFVENGKVTLYKNGEDENFKVTTGGNIDKCKTTISYIATSPNGKKSWTIICEIYFL